MAEKGMQKNRKRKHFEIEKNRQSPFQNQGSKRPTATVVSKAPRGINVAEFAESRALEIQNMMHALANASATSNKRVFQSVPRHMRRRAASHNAKRMPVRLREAYNREAAKSQEKMKESKKKRSRKQRRKPSSLLEEYNRRQRRHVWLETHIWHAKRFKMEEQWGYKIPLHSNDKSVRASYRAMATGCLMQDLSYYQCIEVSGKQESIIAAMKHLTNSDAGLTMAAKQYLNGMQEGHLVLYGYDKYPLNAIGPVRFLWQQLFCNEYENGNLPSNEKTCDRRPTKLWVWSHPACRDDVSREITRACSLEGRTKSTEKKSELDESTLAEGKEPEGFPGSNATTDPCEFVVNVLKEQLVRFCLTGPKSHALLASALELCEWGMTKESEDRRGDRWWELYRRDRDWQNNLMNQNALWEQMKGVASPGVLVTGSVVALVVKDPRLGLPLRKSNVDSASGVLYEEQGIGEPAFTRCPAGSAVSPLWESSVRDEVKKRKLPEKELNELRSKLIVPGSKLDLGDDESRIPILVIQRPGARGDAKTGSINFGCGYDVIIPAGWSMSFWIAFVYRGARVGGSRELATCSREQAVAHFPCDFPDTRAGRQFIEEQCRTGREKYAKYPPAKRPNYDKLGVVSPFSGDWDRLMDEWSNEVGRLETEMGKLVSRGTAEEEIVHVLDGRETSHQISSSKRLKEGVNDVVSSHEHTTTDTNQITPGFQLGLDEMVASSNHNTIETNQTFPGIQGGVDKVEAQTDQVEIHNDTSTLIRTDSASSSSCPRQNFFVIRSYSKRRRLQQIILSLRTAFSVNAKTKSAKGNVFSDHIEYLRSNLGICLRSLVSINVLMLFKGCPLINALIFIPAQEDFRALKKDKNYGGPVEHVHRNGKNDRSKDSKSSSLISDCSRKAIGFVSSGEYSFARGQGSAVGFCAFPGICELVLMACREKCRPLVLVRNTTSFQYRFASFNVV